MPPVRWRKARGLLRRIHFFLTILVAMTAVMPASGISIDNDIVGEPDIECLDQEIRVWVKTRKVFAGRIYAKGHADDNDCARDDFAKLRTKKPHYDLSLGMCGMKSLRSFDPRGMYYGITIVVSFHPLFITKVDQAFHVKCFFEEANRGLTAELGVSMIPTTEVEARHGIPGCTYSIHRASIDDLDAGKPAGAPIQFSKVGDKVLHQFHCDDQMFGILINNCYVTDGVNKRADVIDARGCPVDPLLITGIRYSDDMQRAYAESQVFKFADRPGVWFFCQIQMCMKKEGMCDGITPPTCGDGEGGKSSLVSTIKSSRPRAGRPRQPPSASPDEYEYGGDNISPPTKQRPPSTKIDKSEYDGDGNQNDDTDAIEEDEDNEDANSSPYRPTKAPKRQDVTYGLDSEEYDAKEPVTVFGPAVAPEASNAFNRDSKHGKKPDRSDIVSTDFETADDLSRGRKTNSNSRGTPNDTNSDYVDYNSDVTIPPNLTDLLANLPDDINADSLQRLFRDSVADRRTLLQGFDELINKMKSEKPRPPTSLNRPPTRRSGEKIDTMHVSWESQRMARDLALSTRGDIPTLPTPQASTAIRPPHEDPNAPPMISGQLLIYDLDETPPSDANNEAVRLIAATAGDCAISRHGLLILSLALGSLASLMFCVIVALCFRLRTAGDKEMLLDFHSGPKNSSFDHRTNSLRASTPSSPSFTVYDPSRVAFGGNGRQPSITDLINRRSH